MPRGKSNNPNYKLINLETGKETLYNSKTDLIKDTGLNEYTIRTTLKISNGLVRNSHTCKKYSKLFRIEKIEPIIKIP